MSYLGNTSDLESEKMDFSRNRKTNIVSKLQAHKISSEPKWSNKHDDDSDSESTNENFLTKGNIKYVYKILLFVFYAIFFLLILINLTNFVKHIMNK